MPTITISVKDICGLIGKEMSPEQLTEVLNLTKCSAQGSTGDEMTVEITSDRPDLLSAEGIARELKGLLEIEIGFRKFKTTRSNVVLRIDRSVLDIRPYMSSAVIENVNLSGEAVRQIMQMQEKLHSTYGRNRRNVSIGVHNLDKITHALTYSGVKPDKINFTPLDETRSMNGKEILELTPKGRDYGDIIKNFDRYPLLYDSDGNVLSLPPIINGVLTRVTDQTKNILLDVTGTDKAMVDHVVTLIATTLAERGANIGTVKVIAPRGQERTPDLKGQVWRLRTEKVQEVLGVNLASREIAHELKRMRYGVRREKRGVLTIIAPAYRKDLLHEVDLIEDIAIAYGLSQFKPVVPLTATIGRKEESPFSQELSGISWLDSVFKRWSHMLWLIHKCFSRE